MIGNKIAMTKTVIKILCHVCAGLGISALLTLSCAAHYSAQYFQPIMGYWETDRGIIMSIYETPDAGVAAVIRQATGFAGEEMRTGYQLITRIEPLTGGGYTGRFQIPGSEEYAPVELRLESGDELVILTRDRRSGGNIMRWSRFSGNIP